MMIWNAASGVRRDLYQQVTSKIIEDMERGVRPWLKPWSTRALIA